MKTIMENWKKYQEDVSIEEGILDDIGSAAKKAGQWVGRKGKEALSGVSHGGGTQVGPPPKGPSGVPGDPNFLPPGFSFGEKPAGDAPADPGAKKQLDPAWLAAHPKQQPLSDAAQERIAATKADPRHVPIGTRSQSFPPGFRPQNKRELGAYDAEAAEGQWAQESLGEEPWKLSAADVEADPDTVATAAADRRRRGQPPASSFRPPWTKDQDPAAPGGILDPAQLNRRAAEYFPGEKMEGDPVSFASRAAEADPAPRESWLQRKLGGWKAGKVTPGGPEVHARAVSPWVDPRDDTAAKEMAAGRRRHRRRARREGLAIPRSKLTKLIKEELREIMDLPSDLSTPAGPEEERMDALSKGWEELITDRILDGETGIWSNTDVVDPVDGERRALDEFLAILGNYVVSDEIDEGTARDLVKTIANQISDNLFEPSPHEWGIPLPKWENMPGFEPQDELQEGGRAGHYKRPGKGGLAGQIGGLAGQIRRWKQLGGEAKRVAGHYERPEEESDLASALKTAVRAWRPETSEGEQYEEDILNLLHRFDTPELQEVRAPFPTGSRVRHEDYGVGTVTHAGTKHTNVAVNFDDAGPKQVSRGSLKRAESPKKRSR